jgi:hypothetical protein
MRNKAGRTALALAFGEHPGQSYGVRFDADRKFFRAAILPFLEEHVIRLGKKALVIHEFNVGYDLSGLQRDNKEHEEIIRALLRQTEEKANNALGATLNAGIPLAPDQGWFDWGYAERIAEINRSIPGAITNIVEPLRPSTVWLMWEQTLACERSRGARSFEESVEIEMEAISGSIDICLGRSRRVAALVKEARESRPDMAIIVPRGFAHRGMADEFDYSEFEMTVSYGLRGAPLFSSEAIIESFGRLLGEDELRRYALLSLHFDDYLRRAWLPGIRKSGAQLTKEAIWEARVAARRHALDSVDAQERFRKHG